MQTPSVSIIISRAITILVLIVALIYGLSFYKKIKRKSAIVTELRELSSDSSFFRQFYAEDASKTLVRAVGLILESKALGVEPDITVDRALKLEKSLFSSEDSREDTPARSDLIRSSLLGNYDNAVKLGYTSEYRTLASMKNGELPSIPTGPHRGATAEISHLIDPALSPGLEKVVANLVIRPPGYSQQTRTDIDIAAAKRLVYQLSNAGIIESTVRARIEASLTPPKQKAE